MIPVMGIAKYFAFWLGNHVWGIMRRRKRKQMKRCVENDYVRGMAGEEVSRDHSLTQTINR
jgi:hypothetical protein